MARSLRVGLVLLCAAAAAVAQDLVVRNARIISGKDAVAVRGSILIEDGRISRIGRVGSTGSMVPEIDAAGRFVTPGFVLAETSQGLSRSNERMDVVPFLSVLDDLDPGSGFFEDSLRDGHLTMLVVPGDRTVIGGMGRIVHAYGLTIEDMTVVPEPGLKISMIPADGNRAAHVSRLRRTLEKARNRLEYLKEAGELDEVELTGNWDVDLERMQVAIQERAMLRLLKGDYPALVSCGTPGDVVQAVRLGEEFGLRLRLVCEPTTWRAASYLGERDIPVILRSRFEIEEEDPETGEKVRRVVPRIFHEEGVRFAVCSSPSGLGRRYLWYQGASLVRYGIPEDVAFRAITAVPAELIGLGERKGTLEAGKDGDLLILTDHPFSGRAWVDRAVIGGRVVYRRDRDPRLTEVFGAGG